MPTMTPAGFDILYEEGPCLVVAKPGGLLTQAPRGIDSLEVRIKQFLKVRDDKPGNVYLGVPHRLDRPSSGALVVAKHVRAARRLSDQFEGRMVGKTYWVLVEGVVGEDEGSWTDHLRKIPERAKGEVVERSTEGARSAVLHYRVRQRWPDRTWLEMKLETGRYHQIRIQAAARELPVVGDKLYGATIPFGPEVESDRDAWIALHARSLQFRHPMTRDKVCVTAPLPPPWRDAGIDVDAC